MSITKYLLLVGSDISSEPFKASGMNKLCHLSRVANDTWIPNLKFKYPDYHLFVEDVFFGAGLQDHMWKDVCSVFFFTAITENLENSKVTLTMDERTRSFQYFTWPKRMQYPQEVQVEQTFPLGRLRNP